jgi:hypothetical protein
MVAIKAAHERLNAKDLWPGLPWTWEDTLRIQDECRQKAIDSGVTEHPYLQFAAAREYEKYMSMFPRFGDRQKIMASIYPHKRTNFGVSLTEEEAQYLVDRLFGANDEVGQRILSKLQSSLEKK